MTRSVRQIRTMVMAALMLVSAAGAQAATVSVFAAASLAGALEEAVDPWEQGTGNQVTVVAAGSSALARQVAAGAPADVVILANLAWMDWLDAQGLVAPDRRILLSNRLVLVAHGDGPDTREDITETFPVLDLLGPENRLATALVESVPAGIYARQALEHLGLWSDLAPRLAQTDNVRAALALVALGEAPLGVVYATDAAAAPEVHVVGAFPEDSHAPIIYPAALVADSTQPDAAEALLDWLSGEASRAVFARHGFGLPGE